MGPNNKSKGKSKIKVCFTTTEYPPDIGGVAKSSERVVNFLSQSGFDVHIFAPMSKVDNTDDLFSLKIIENIKLYRVNQRLSDAFVKAISLIDKKEEFNIFHGFFLASATPCIKVAENRNRPVIVSLRGIDGNWFQESKFYHWSKDILNKASWITSVSSESLSRANELVDIKHKSSFIFNSIISESCTPWKLTEDNHKVVGTVAVFNPKKKIPLLVEAYANIEPTWRRKLLLVGDFLEGGKPDMYRKNSFHELCNFLKVTDEVEITGYVENTSVWNYLSAMNVFVLSSKHEGLPNAVLEAIALGMPIVATSVDGIKDILCHQVNALLVPPDDMVSMRDAIVEILRNDSLATQLSSGALELNRRLTPEAEREKWLKLYSDLLA